MKLRNVLRKLLQARRGGKALQRSVTAQSSVFDATTYVLFQLGFLFLNKTFLFGSSAFVGLAAAFIWTAQGSYIA
uniref:GtrA-like protein domain-containing protein n=1 Tax=Ditylenchus dipsaci TaxID=166011 RepID=A0A915E0P2_9BILA